MRKSTVKPGLRAVNEVLRVAIYLRVSTAKQVQGYGLSVQDEQCRAWLDYKIGKGRYTIVKVYTDGGVSGKLASRPDFDIMNGAIEAGAYDLVVFGKLDRIGRTMGDIHLWVYHTTKSGVRVATADGRIDSEDEMFGIQLSLLAYMAETEHTLILERTMGGRERKVNEGKWPGGPLPYGLRLEGHGANGVIALHDAEIKILEIGAQYLIETKGNQEEAARKLNAADKLTRTGKPWTGGNLALKYTSTSLDGYVIYRNTDRSGPTSVKLNEDGTPFYGETIHIAVPRALPEETVTAVRKALTRRSITKSASRDYLLTRRVFGPCGNYYVGSYRNNRDHTRYQCTGRAVKSEKHCSCKEIDAPTLEKVIWSEVASRVGSSGSLRDLAEEWLGTIPARAVSYRERLAELDVQIEKKRKSRKQKVLALLAAVEMDDDDDESFDLSTVEELKENLRSKERELQKLRDDTFRGLQETEQQEARVREIIKLAEEMDPSRESYSFEQRLDLLEMLDVRVDITSEVPGQVRPANCPFEAWFEAKKKLVPVRLTDADWDRMKDVFPQPKLRGRAVDRRLVIEATLQKVRNGICWNELPEDRYGRWQTLYHNAVAWMRDGTWDAAMAALGDYEGVDLLPAYQLPSMKITVDLDPRLSADSRQHECATTEDSRVLLVQLNALLQSEVAS